MNVKTHSLSAFAYSFTLPSSLLCSCVTRSVLPSALITLLCPFPYLALRNDLSSSPLVVRPKALKHRPP